MGTEHILAALAGVFLLAGAVRRLTAGPGPQSRTWLLVGAIFAAVSVYLVARN